jgi:Cytochrome P460
MKCWNAILAVSSSVATISFLAVVYSATAGPDKVNFPIYQTHVLYDVLDKIEDKEVMEFYVNPEVVKQIKPGQPLPSGTVLSRPTFKARLNDKGEMLKDANGRLIRGNLDRVVVMEKRPGWGTEYPDALRNGEWEYGRFSADGTLTTTANYKACFECHKPLDKQDFVFTLPQLLKVAR